jgi:hypothetical protein
MFFPFLLAAATSLQLSNCVPARWPSPASQSLSLLEGSPINCLLLDPPQWKSDFLGAARGRRLLVLGVIGGSAVSERARQAVEMGVDGLVLEGDIPDSESSAVTKIARDASLPLIELASRARMFSGGNRPVTGTMQGLWPGVKIEQSGAAHSGPTGAPWIDTNAGFLRYARAAAPGSTAIWMANRPPEKRVLTAQHYIQAIADAAMSGARWVVALDGGFAELLLKKDAAAVDGWKKINQVLSFYERNKELWALPDYSGLVVVQDARSGALVSGGVLDMIASRHTPVSVVPTQQLGSAGPPSAQMLLNIDPESLTPEQRETVRGVARRGATVLNGPPGWKMDLPTGEQITFPQEEIKKLDEIWREINGVIGRRNFAVRIFGAPSMLSSLKAPGAGARFALHLVNYSGYPVENISIHFAGKIAKAALLTPEGERKADLYNVEEGTGADIDKIQELGILILEPDSAGGQPKR